MSLSLSTTTLASITSSSPLPVELVDFDATLTDGVVNLTWQTASELNNDYFTLEKSTD